MDQLIPRTLKDMQRTGSCRLVQRPLVWSAPMWSRDQALLPKESVANEIRGDLGTVAVPGAVVHRGARIRGDRRRAALKRGD